MAVLIPALGSCVGRMTSGERRLAERLQQKLEDDYLLWWDVPIGPKQTRPDFVVIHPHRGALILETKDWHLETIKKGLEFPVVTLPGVGYMPAAGEAEAARVFYVAATRATIKLLIGVGGPSAFGSRL